MLNTLSTEEFQFIKAIELYKAQNRKTFLSWSEVLKIVKELGYRQQVPWPTTNEAAAKDRKSDHRQTQSGS